MENTKPVSKKQKLKNFFEEKAFFFTFLKQFSITVLIYGLIFNLTLYSLFNLSISISHLLSLGFLIYFLKEEIPDIIKSCKN